MPIWIHSARRAELYTVQKSTEVAKNCEKDALRGFKVIQGRRICHKLKGRIYICDCLLVVNYNVGCISHDFGAVYGD